MIRIAITPAAFDAIAATLSLGSLGFELEVTAKGERAIWVTTAVADRLSALRGLGKDIPTSSSGSWNSRRVRNACRRRPARPPASPTRGFETPRFLVFPLAKKEAFRDNKFAACVTFSRVAQRVNCANVDLIR